MGYFLLYRGISPGGGKSPTIGGITSIVGDSTTKGDNLPTHRGSVTMPGEISLYLGKTLLYHWESPKIVVNMA